MSTKFFAFAIIINKHDNCHPTDNCITYPAKFIRLLSKHKISQSRRPDNQIFQISLSNLPNAISLHSCRFINRIQIFFKDMTKGFHFTTGHIQLFHRPRSYQIIPIAFFKLFSYFFIFIIRLSASRKLPIES